MANVEIANGGGGRSLLGRRPESPSIDNRIEGEIPVPNLPNMLPLDGVPFGKSTSSSSSSSPCAAEETGYRPPEKPHEPSIFFSPSSLKTRTRYYGEPFFSGHSLFPKVLDEYWRNFKDNYSWNPYRADIARRDFEDLSVGLIEGLADIERRFRVEKIIQRYSGVRSYQLHLSSMLKINARPVGYFVERTKGGVKTDCRKLYHLNRLVEKGKRPAESSSVSFRATEARRAEQRKKFKYELEKKDEKFEELNQKLEAMETVLEQISQKVLGCSLPWLGTRPPPVPPLP
ncbi:hypothetical protein Drorol1_Dr00011629 [Drosera rotundifolia]